MMVKNQNSSQDKVDPPKAQDPDSVVQANKKVQPLEGGHSMKIGRMRNLKHEISSPKLYEIHIKT